MTGLGEGSRAAALAVSLSHRSSRMSASPNKRLWGAMNVGSVDRQLARLNYAATVGRSYAPISGGSSAGHLADDGAGRLCTLRQRFDRVDTFRCRRARRMDPKNGTAGLVSPMS